MFYLKWNLPNENVFNCDNASESEVTENFSMKDEKEDNRTHDKGILEVTDIRASKINNDLQAFSGRNNDRISEIPKDEYKLPLP
jgi:hypothetical protein